MKVKIEDLKDSQKLIKIEAGPERVIGALNEVYTDIQKKAQLPGFRPGKVPMDLVKIHYEKTAKEEMLSRLIWDCYQDAITDNNLNPIGYPVIEDVNYDGKGPLTFSAKIDVSPEFKLKQYKGIKIKEVSSEVSDKDIDEALSNIRESMAEYKDIDPRPIAIGDYAICHYECFSDGNLVDKNDKLWLYISDQLQPKELFDAMIGLEVNIAKEVTVTYPKDYQHKELAGKTRLYKITPNQIKHKVLPEIDDNLAKKAGRFSTLADLKKLIRENISKAKAEQAQRNIESQICDYLVKNHPFDVPNSIVDKQAQRLAEDTKLKLLYQGYNKEDLDKEDDNLKKSLSSKAKDNVRTFFIFQDIARAENMEVSAEELDKKIDDIAASGNEKSRDVKSKLEEKGLIDNLKEQILHDKVMDFLIANAKKSS